MTDAMIDTERVYPTDAELEAEAIITPDDVARAVEMWDRYSGMPGLLDAEPCDGELTAE